MMGKVLLWALSFMRTDLAFFSYLMVTTYNKKIKFQ